MKRNIIIQAAAIVAMLLVGTAANAREWHINNKAGVPAHFADINAAMASEEVIEGDTLYIGAGCLISSNQTISKKVTVIGTGWGYSGSPATQARINGDVTITANGAVVVGLYASGTCCVNANSITVQRCNFTAIKTTEDKYVNSARILSCYTGQICGRSDKKRGKDWEIRNNVVDGNPYYTSFDHLYSATIENNIIRNTTYVPYNSNIGNLLQDCHYSVVKNNILICTSHNNQGGSMYGCSFNTIEHNVMSMSSGFNDTNIMLGSTELSNIFKCTGSIPSGEYFSLKEDSPAIGAGEGGIDCGVMAGAYSFVPFGRPQYIPVIKKAVVPAIPTDGRVKVSFKIENQND